MEKIGFFLTNKETITLHNLMFKLSPEYVLSIGLTDEDNETLFTIFRKLVDISDIIECNDMEIK